MTSKLQERAIEAAAVFVERRRYDVFDKAWSPEEGISIDLVTRDGDDVVLTDVAACEGIDKGLPEEDPAGSRQCMEIAAARWLRNAPTTSETSSSGVFATIKLDTSVHFYATTDKCPPPFLANWRTRAVRQPPRQERLSSYYGPRARYLLRMTRKVKRSRRRMILSIRLPPAL